MHAHDDLFEASEEFSERPFDRVRAERREAALAEAVGHRRRAEAEFRAHVARHAPGSVKVLSRVHDAMAAEGGPRDAARLLVCWRDAGGLSTRERGAAELADLCRAASDFLAATVRVEYLLAANRPQLANESTAPIVA